MNASVCTESKSIKYCSLQLTLHPLYIAIAEHVRELSGFCWNKMDFRGNSISNGAHRTQFKHFQTLIVFIIHKQLVGFGTD